MNPHHMATDLTELLQEKHKDAKVARFLTTTGSEGINIEFAPGHAINVIVTRARTDKRQLLPWQPKSKRHMSN